MDDANQADNNENYSILTLNPSTLSKISDLLNPRKILKTERGLPRDWKGLAILCSIPGQLIPNVSNSQDPTAKILKLWHENSPTEATVSKLLGFLEEIDRGDIFDDVSPLIVQDIKVFKENATKQKAVEAFDFEQDKKILTRDDVQLVTQGLQPQRYDAFVLFAEDDIDFASELIKTMESDYELKFCVKERDLVGGGSEHDAVIKLITERCGRLIVIVSDAFLKSNACKFFYSLTQSISIEQRRRTIIPCLYKDCQPLPPELSCYFKLDIRRAGPLWNYWERLYDSIIMPEYKPNMSRTSKLSLPENSLFNGVESMNAGCLRVGNSVSRSASNPNNLLLPNDMRSPLYKGLQNSSCRSIVNSVKFSSSMSNLPITEVPQENMAPSTSATSIEKYEEKGMKKTLSFVRKIKSITSVFPKAKIKSDKQVSSKVQPENEIKDKRNGVTQSKIMGNKKDLNQIEQIEENRIKKDKDKKKWRFTMKKNKKKENNKKAVMADT